MGQPQLIEERFSKKHSKTNQDNQTSLISKIDAFTKINIVSGDGFFESIIKRLENKDFNLAIYGQEGKTHHKLVEHKNYVPLNNYNLAS